MPSNNQPDSDPKSALFTIADDIRRICARVKRLQDPHAHAESPRTRTRRLISNVRIIERDPLRVETNFVIYRFRCHGQSETPHLGQLKSPHPLLMEVESGREI